MTGSGYDNACEGNTRGSSACHADLSPGYPSNSAGAVENFYLLRDPASGVQAALATFGITHPDGLRKSVNSLGGVFDAAIYIFYRNADPVTLFAQFRGKRLSIGMPGTALRSIMLEVLRATDALDASTYLLDSHDRQKPQSMH